MTAEQPSTGLTTGGAVTALTWGLRATLSREVATRQEAGTKRPGVRHFVPGAALWLGPAHSGDGYEKVEMIGTHRNTGGRQIARLLMPTVRLANFKMVPVYKPALVAKFREGRWWENVAQEGDPPLHEYLRSFAESRNAFVTQSSHFYDLDGYDHWWVPPGRLHWIEEDCGFCRGFAAAESGADHVANPYADSRPLIEDDGWSHARSQRDAWSIGWHTSRYALQPDRVTLPDSDARLVKAATGLVRRRRQATADVVGRGSSKNSSFLVGLDIDRASTIVANMRLRIRILFGDDDGTKMLGRLSVRLDEEDRIIEVRAG